MNSSIRNINNNLSISYEYSDKRIYNLYYILGILMNLPFLVTIWLPDISGISIIYFIIFIILTIVNIGRKKFKKDVLIFLSLILFVYSFDYFFFPKTDYSNYKYWMFILKIPFLLLIPSLFKEYNRSFFKGYFFVTLLFTLILFYLSYKSKGPTAAYDRLEIGILNPIWIARLALENLLVAWLVLKFKLKYLLFLIIIILPIIYLSGSKGPIVALLFVVVMYAFNNHKLWSNRIKRFILLGFLIILASITYVVKSNLIKKDSFFAERFLTFLPDKNEHGGNENRNDIWPNSVRRLSRLDFPSLIMGTGVGNFSLLYHGELSNDREYPHNLLLELFIENGALFFLILFVAFIFYFKRNNENNFKYLFLYFFMNACFSGDILLNQMMFFYMGCMVSDYETYKF